MGRSRSKTTLAAINFGKTASRRRVRREKPQATIVVIRAPQSRATWYIRLRAGGEPARLLPGVFKPKYVAQGLAEDLATAYRKSGYNVVLDTSGRHQ